jgi:predicted RNA-binding protein YlqC (UPF0109 family)
MAKAKDLQYLENILKPLCKSPESLKISRKVDEMGVLLTVNATREDCSTLIGKEGTTANSIRRLLIIFGYMNKLRSNLKITPLEEINV